MTKYYRIRATSMETYYGYINSDDHPDIFDKDGIPIDQNVLDSEGNLCYIDFDMYDCTFPYGVDYVEKDWEFTDYDEINKEDYVNAITKEERGI